MLQPMAQEEEEGLKDTIVFKEKEGQEEGRSLSSLISQQLPHICRSSSHLNIT